MSAKLIPNAAVNDEKHVRSDAHKEEAAREQADLSTSGSTLDDEIEALFDTFDSTLRALSGH